LRKRGDRPKIAATQTAVFSLSFPTGDSGSKKRQAQNNSHFHSRVISWSYWWQWDHTGRGPK